MPPCLRSFPRVCLTHYPWMEKRSAEVVKNSKNFCMTFFCYRFFFFLILLEGIVITVSNIIDLALQTIFCMTSLPNSITSNIISRGRRQQKTGGDSGAVGGSGKGSFAAQRCRGQVLEKRIFFAKTLSFRLSFCYRFGLRFSYVFLYVEASMQCNKKRITRRAGSKWKLSNCWLYKTYI